MRLINIEAIGKDRNQDVIEGDFDIG